MECKPTGQAGMEFPGNVLAEGLYPGSSPGIQEVLVTVETRTSGRTAVRWTSNRFIHDCPRVFNVVVDQPQELR